jgi:hypothetical protein
MVEEEKGGELLRPTVRTMRACIVSMKYSNKKEDGTPYLR